MVKFRKKGLPIAESKERLLRSFAQNQDSPHGTTEFLCVRRRSIAVGEQFVSAGGTCGSPMGPIRLAIRLPTRASGTGSLAR